MGKRTNPKKYLVMALLFFGIYCPTAAAGIIYVDCNAPGPIYDGNSWPTAYKYLQDALADANSAPKPVEIWVAAGTYTPDPCGLTDPREASFQMKNGVGIYGGFAGDEDPCSFDLADRDFTTNESILSGDIGVADNNADNCYHVIYNRQGTTLDSSAILDGFTITRSMRYGGSPVLGGGMLNYGTSIYPCSPTVTNCTFRDNHAQYGGAMVNTNYSSPTVTNCTFSGNSSYSFEGGGMCNTDNSSPMVTNCTFRDNLALVGGGMGNYDSSPTVTNCTFRDNLATAGAGVGNRANSSPTVTNCTFSGNEASDKGGGFYNDEYSSPTVTDCNFITNTAVYSGGGMYSQNNSSPTVTNCIFIGNSATGTYYYNGGGGMYNYNYSSPTVTNCTFSGNTANYGGGGMYNTYSSLTVTNCTFSGNEASENGGGMYNHRSSQTLTNCTFVGNIAPNGGALYNISFSLPTLINCIVYDNSATVAGGGIYNATNSPPVLTNCTFYNNTATTYGGGMYNLNLINSSPTVTNCILWGDLPDEIYNSSASPTVTYSDVQGGWPDANNTNIDADPYFVDPNNPDPNLCNLRLKPDSPCIDAGDSTIGLAVPIYFDLDGKDRYLDIDSIDDTGSGPWEFLDMGAYEFDCNYTHGDVNCDGVVDFRDMAILAGNWLEGIEPEL